MNADDVVNDLSAAIGRLLLEGSGFFVVRVDAEGRIVYANSAFARACGESTVGQRFASFVTAGSQELLAAQLAGDSAHPLKLHIVAADGPPQALRAFVQVLPDGFALVGEPEWDDHLALERRLHASNAELDVIAREHSRQARRLEEALRELKETHWQLKKIGNVLPMCVSCRSVKTGENAWETVADYLAKTSDFLSHGYCVRCAAAVTDAGPGV